MVGVTRASGDVQARVSSSHYLSIAPLLRKPYVNRHCSHAHNEESWQWRKCGYLVSPELCSPKWAGEGCRDDTKSGEVMAHPMRRRLVLFSVAPALCCVDEHSRQTI